MAKETYYLRTTADRWVAAQARGYLSESVWGNGTEATYLYKKVRGNHYFLGWDYEEETDSWIPRHDRATVLLEAMVDPADVVQCGAGGYTTEQIPIDPDVTCITTEYPEA